MEHKIIIANNKSVLDDSIPFQVTHYKWNSTRSPKTWGQLAWIEEQGLFVRMTCEESDPLCTYDKPQDPVYLDSAMEFFFHLQKQEDLGKALSLDTIYMNFEFNANAAMLARYGTGQRETTPRVNISDAHYNACGCKACVKENCWSVEFLIPQDLICEVFEREAPQDGDRLYCNFYKISQTPEIEHYGSFSPVNAETPNFHTPQFFAELVFCKDS